MSFATLLTQEQVERIHEASLEILEEVGLKVRYRTCARNVQTAWLCCGR